MRSLVAVLLLVPALAHAETPREYFQRADAADKDGRYADAIADYERAYVLSPHPDVLFNIGVDYERLQDWAKAADYFQRYLDERDTPAPDADQVKKRIRELRAKAPEPPPAHDEPPPMVKVIEPSPPPVAVTTVAPATTSEEPVWHLGVSYGLAFGDAPSERYLIHGGRRLFGRLDTDVIGGMFGNNDYAVGVTARFVVLPDGWSPVLRAGATIGRAKQDNSSRAGTKYPVGFELGGGLQVGRHGRFELDAVMRFVRGGWDASSTTVDSYVNDATAFAVDLGFSFDIPFTVGVQ